MNKFFDKCLYKFMAFFCRYYYTNAAFFWVMMPLEVITFFDIIDGGFWNFMFVLTWCVTLLVGVIYDTIFPESSFDELVYKIGYFVIGVALTLLGDVIDDKVTENNLNSAVRRHEKAFYGNKNNQAATKADLAMARQAYYNQRSK